MNTYTSFYAARAAAALDEGFRTKSAQKDARSDVQRAYEAILGAASQTLRDRAPYQNVGGGLSPEQYAERSDHFAKYDLPFELRHVRDRHVDLFSELGADVSELGKLVTLLEAVSKAEVAPKPAKVERKASIEGGQLTCQCCGRLIKANKGEIAHHGYQRPGDGWQTSSCWGAKHLPFEASRDALDRYLVDLRDTISKYEAFPGKIERNEVQPYIRVRDPGSYRPRSERTIWIDRDEFEEKKVEHNLRQYGVYTFEDLQAHCISNAKLKLKHVRAEYEQQKARFDSWPGPSIRWDGDRWVAL